MGDTDRRLIHTDRIDPTTYRVLQVLLPVVALSIVAHVVNLNTFESEPLDLNQEASLGTWVGTVLFALAAGGAATIAAVRRRTEWWMIAAVATALSIDDVLQLHERFEDLVDADTVVLLA